MLGGRREDRRLSRPAVALGQDRPPLPVASSHSPGPLQPSQWPTLLQEVVSSPLLGEKGVRLCSSCCVPSQSQHTAPSWTLCATRAFCGSLNPNFWHIPVLSAAPPPDPVKTLTEAADACYFLLCSWLHCIHVPILWAAKWLCASDTKQTWISLKEIKICWSCKHLLSCTEHERKAINVCILEIFPTWGLKQK